MSSSEDSDRFDAQKSHLSSQVRKLCASAQLNNMKMKNAKNEISSNATDMLIDRLFCIENPLEARTLLEINPALLRQPVVNEENPRVLQLQKEILEIASQEMRQERTCDELCERLRQQRILMEKIHLRGKIDGERIEVDDFVFQNEDVADQIRRSALQIKEAIRAGQSVDLVLQKTKEGRVLDEAAPLPDKSIVLPVPQAEKKEPVKEFVKTPKHEEVDVEWFIKSQRIENEKKPNLKKSQLALEELMQ